MAFLAQMDALFVKMRTGAWQFGKNIFPLQHEIHLDNNR